MQPTSVLLPTPATPPLLRPRELHRQAYIRMQVRRLLLLLSLFVCITCTSSSSLSSRSNGDDPPQSLSSSSSSDDYAALEQQRIIADQLVQQLDVELPSSSSSSLSYSSPRSFATSYSTCPCFPFLSSRLLVIGHGSPSDSPYWANARAGFLEAGKRVRATVDTFFVTSDQLKNSFGGSATVAINTLLDEQLQHYETNPPFPDVLIVSIPNAAAMKSRIQKFLDQNTRLIAFNGALADAKELGAYYLFAADDYLSGKQTGIRMAQAGVRRASCLISNNKAASLVDRCLGFTAGFNSACTDPVTCSVETVSIPISDTVESTVDASTRVFANSTIQGIAIVGSTITQRIIPLFTDPKYAQPDRRIAIFDLVDDTMYSLLDSQSIFFLVDSQPWLQGFGSVLFGAYLTQTGQHLASSAVFMRTGPSFISARGSSRHVRPKANELRLDVVTQTAPYNNAFWTAFQGGVQEASEYLGLQFEDCSGSIGESEPTCKDAKQRRLNTLLYHAPAISLDIGTMANYINRAGEGNTHGIVTTIPSVDVLSEPIKNIVQAGIPVFSANTGYDSFAGLGILAHVGQDEYQAGFTAGRTAGMYGAVRALCLISSLQNTAFGSRCKGFRQGLLSYLNQTKSPWFLNGTDCSLDLNANFAQSSSNTNGTSTVEQIILDTLAAHPEINFVLQARGIDHAATTAVLIQTGRWNTTNSSAVNLGAFRQPDNGSIPIGSTTPPPYPFSSDSLPWPLLFGQFDLDPSYVPLILSGQVCFTVIQQERLEGFLTTMLLGIRILTGAMLNTDTAFLYPSGPSVVTARNVTILSCANRGMCDPPSADRNASRLVTRAAPSSLRRLASLSQQEHTSLSFASACPVPQYSGDGYCDFVNNVEGCYDGGDCCGSTCGVNAPLATSASPFRTLFNCGNDTYNVGWNSYDCQDPTAAENKPKSGDSAFSNGASSPGFIALYVILGVVSFCLCFALAAGWVKFREYKRLRKKERSERLLAETQTKIRSLFLAHMSHEIRTPINGILGMSNLLKTTNLTDEQLEYSSAIEFSSMHLLTIINDILDFSRIDSEKLKLTMGEFSLRGLIEDSIDMAHQPALHARHSDIEIMMSIQFHEQLPGIISGDEQRCRQILVNLLSNACKFTSSPGEVEVMVHYAPDMNALYKRGLHTAQIMAGEHALHPHSNQTPTPKRTSPQVPVGSSSNPPSSAGIELANLPPHAQSSSSLSPSSSKFYLSRRFLDGYDISPPHLDEFALPSAEDTLNNHIHQTTLLAALPPQSGGKFMKPKKLNGAQSYSQSVTEPARRKHRLHNQSNNDSSSSSGSGTNASNEIRSSGPFVLFGIRDTGAGIPRAQQSKLFSPFTQLDNSSTRRWQGTGLGLAISYKLAQAMDGYVWLVSEEGSGSIFYFALPLKVDQTKYEKRLSEAHELVLRDQRAHQQLQQQINNSDILVALSASTQSLAQSLIESRLSIGRSYIRPVAVLLIVSLPAFASSLYYLLRHFFKQVDVAQNIEQARECLKKRIAVPWTGRRAAGARGGAISISNSPLDRVRRITSPATTTTVTNTPANSGNATAPRSSPPAAASSSSSASINSGQLLPLASIIFDLFSATSNEDPSPSVVPIVGAPSSVIASPTKHNIESALHTIHVAKAMRKYEEEMIAMNPGINAVNSKRRIPFILLQTKGLHSSSTFQQEQYGWMHHVSGSQTASHQSSRNHDYQTQQQRGGSQIHNHDPTIVVSPPSTNSTSTSSIHVGTVHATTNDTSLATLHLDGPPPRSSPPGRLIGGVGAEHDTVMRVIPERSYRSEKSTSHTNPLKEDEQSERSRSRSRSNSKSYVYQPRYHLEQDDIDLGQEMIKQREEHERQMNEELEQENQMDARNAQHAMNGADGEDERSSMLPPSSSDVSKANNGIYAHSQQPQLMPPIHQLMHSRTKSSPGTSRLFASPPIAGGSISSPTSTPRLRSRGSIDVAPLGEIVTSALASSAHILAPFEVLHKPLRQLRLLSTMWPTIDGVPDPNVRFAAAGMNFNVNGITGSPKLVTRNVGQQAHIDAPAHTIPASADVSTGTHDFLSSPSQVLVEFAQPTTSSSSSSAVVIPAPIIVNDQALANSKTATMNGTSSVHSADPSSATSVSPLLPLPPQSNGVGNENTASASASSASAAVTAVKPMSSSSKKQMVPGLNGIPMGEPLHVLIVEDQAMNVKLLQKMLSKLGHTSSVAVNGQLALDAVVNGFNHATQQQAHDIILMDVAMPVMDGMESTRCIRRWFAELPPLPQPGTTPISPASDTKGAKDASAASSSAPPITYRRPPIILGLTAHAMLSDHNECIQSGMNCVLTKPLALKDLHHAIEQYRPRPPQQQ